MAASFMAHSRARCEWPEPSTPTMMPGISVLLLLEVLPIDARSARSAAAGPTGPPARDFGPLFWLGQLLAGRIDHLGVAVSADADHAVQADPAARLEARDLRTAVEHGGQVAGRVGHLAGQHVVARDGPDLGRAQAALHGRLAGLVQRPDRVGTGRRNRPLVVPEAVGFGCPGVFGLQR